MHRIYNALIEILAAAIFIVPLLGIYNKIFFHNRKQTVFYGIFTFYLAAMLALVGFPNVRYLRIDLEVNLIPFKDMIPDFVNACLNILLFVPFGFFLPILWKKFRNWKNTMSMGLAATFIIEFAQIFTFRTTDINDIITNMMGTIIGYFLAYSVTKKFSRYIVSDTKDKDFYLLCSMVGFVMFFLQPFISAVLWEEIL